MIPTDVREQAQACIFMARQRQLRLALAETTSGGAIASLLTAIPGASRVLEASVVAYGYEAQSSILGVPESLLQTHGSVSRPVVQAMASGLLDRVPVDIVLAESGIAGPAGGTRDKPVGLTYIALQGRNGLSRCESYQLTGDRSSIRQQIIGLGLQLLLATLTDL